MWMSHLTLLSIVLPKYLILLTSSKCSNVVQLLKFPLHFVVWKIIILSHNVGSQELIYICIYQASGKRQNISSSVFFSSSWQNKHRAKTITRCSDSRAEKTKRDLLFSKIDVWCLVTNNVGRREPAGKCIYRMTWVRLGNL